MEISFITEYVSPIALVICLAVGFLIKYCGRNATLNRFIPCIVAVLGIVICVWVEQSFTPQIAAAGLISGLASTGLYEAFKQIIGFKDEGDEKNEVIPDKTKKDEDDPAAVIKNQSIEDSTKEE